MLINLCACLLRQKLKNLNFMEDAGSVEETSFMLDLQEFEATELFDLSGCVSWEPAACWPILKQQFSGLLCAFLLLGFSLRLPSAWHCPFFLLKPVLVLL